MKIHHCAPGALFFVVLMIMTGPAMALVPITGSINNDVIDQHPIVTTPALTTSTSPSSLIAPGISTGISPGTSSNVLPHNLPANTPGSTSQTTVSNLVPNDYAGTITNPPASGLQEPGLNLDEGNDVGVTSPQLNAPTQVMFSTPDFGTMTTNQSGFISPVSVSDFPVNSGPMQINPAQTGSMISQGVLLSQDDKLLFLQPDRKEIAEDALKGGGLGSLEGPTNEEKIQDFLDRNGQSVPQIPGHEKSDGFADTSLIDGKTSMPFAPEPIRDGTMPNIGTPSSENPVTLWRIIKFGYAILSAYGAAKDGAELLGIDKQPVVYDFPQGQAGYDGAEGASGDGGPGPKDPERSITPEDLPIVPKPKESDSDPNGAGEMDNTFLIALHEAQFAELIAQAQDNTHYYNGNSENNENDMSQMYIQGQINKDNYIGPGFHGQSPSQNNGFGSTGEGFDVGIASYQVAFIPNLMPSGDPTQESAEDRFMHFATDPIVNPDTGS